MFLCVVQVAAAPPPLKLAALGGGPVLRPTEFLMIETSLCTFCVHLTASWTWWRCRSTVAEANSSNSSRQEDAEQPSTAAHINKIESVNSDNTG